MREEGQRGHFPEPDPAGSRARPPRVPPAPPGLFDGPAPGHPAAPMGTDLLQAVIPLLTSAAAIRHALRSPAPDVQLDAPRLSTPAEARAALVRRCEELLARLSLGELDLSDPLLRVYQNQLLEAHCRMPGDGGPGWPLTLDLLRLSLRDYPDDWGANAAAWERIPLAEGESVACLFQLAPRDFTRRLIQRLLTAARNDVSYVNAARFDAGIMHPAVALVCGAVSAVEWMRQRTELLKDVDFPTNRDEKGREP